MTFSLSYAVHNVFLIVMVAVGLTLTLHLLSWATSGLGYSEYDTTGYQGYYAPTGGEKSYMSHQSPHQSPHHLLSLLSPEALTGLLERIQTEGPAVGRMGTGETQRDKQLYTRHFRGNIKHFKHPQQRDFE